MHFVYILKNPKNKLYIGQTTDLASRIARHNRGDGASFTKSSKDFELVYSEQHETLQKAMKREIQIKKWSRAKKEALISGDLELLKSL